MKRLGEANTDFERRIEAVILGIAAFDGTELRYELAANPVASPVHRATASDCVRIETGQGKPIFLKALQPDMTGHVDYARVAKASRLAAERGVAPALILDEADGGVLGFELLGAGWRHATMGDLNRRHRHRRRARRQAAPARGCLARLALRRLRARRGTRPPRRGGRAWRSRTTSTGCCATLRSRKAPSRRQDTSCASATMTASPRT